VRELRNVIERAHLLSADSICATHIGVKPSDRSLTTKGECARCEVGLSLADVERRMILATLDRFAQNKRESARTLGISLKTLYNRLNSYGLGKSSQRR
jgi:DNA-binding NtrC family response regulator